MRVVDPPPQRTEIDMADQTKRTFRIFQDEIKLRHTTHWDLDTMSRSQLDAYMRGEAPAACARAGDPAQTPQAHVDTGWSRFLRTLWPGR